jgi:hypothetical protein
MLNATRIAARRTAARRERGGAMVEFVLLNIILIPLFLYAIFLMDAAYLKLDLQETVVSGIWDFSQRNSEPPGFGGMGVGAPNSHDDNNAMEVQASEKAVRVAYSDHTSAFDDGAENNQDDSIYGQQSYLTGNGDGADAPSITGHQKHHTGFGAHYSFRFENGPDTQFHCSLSSDTGWNPDPNFRGFGNSGYTAGAAVRCEATGFIYNYIIPETFLQEFSKVKMADKQLKHRKDNTGKGAHEWQDDGASVTTDNIVAFETAGISFNTWALRNGAKNADTYNPDNYNNASLNNVDLRAPQAGIPMPVSASSPEANPFFRRVQYIYTMNGTAPATYGQLTGAVAQLTSRAQSNQIMMMQNVPAGMTSGAMLPNILGVHVTARYQNAMGANPKREQRKPGFFGGTEFESTPYSGSNNTYQTMANARGRYYLGCRQAENPDCF